MTYINDRRTSKHDERRTWDLLNTESLAMLAYSVYRRIIFDVTVYIFLHLH